MVWLYDKIYYLQVVRLPAIMGRLPAIMVVSVTKCIILSSFIIQVVGIVVVELVTCCGISTNFGVQVWNFQSGEHRRLLTNNTYHGEGRGVQFLDINTKLTHVRCYASLVFTNLYC